MQTLKASSSAPLLVACLCAQWCGTCCEYQPLFEQLQVQFPTVRFLWIDIEDQADLVDPIEVENFPTLLIARDNQTLFFGTVTPHLQTLERLVRNTLEPGTNALAPDAQRDALAQRLGRHDI